MLAVGIVVDDAIVVLENVERLIPEQKMWAKQVAIDLMCEVSGAVVAIVPVLSAVFIPVAFLGGVLPVAEFLFARVPGKFCSPEDHGYGTPNGAPLARNGEAFLSAPRVDLMNSLGGCWRPTRLQAQTPGSLSALRLPMRLADDRLGIRVRTPGRHRSEKWRPHGDSNSILVA